MNNTTWSTRSTIFLARKTSWRKFLHKQTHEYIIAYAKNIDDGGLNKISKTDKAIAAYDKTDERGNYRLLGLQNTGVQFFNRQTRLTLYYPIYVCPETGEVSLAKSDQFSVEVLPVFDDGTEGYWTWSKQKILDNSNFIVGKQVRSEKWKAYRKDYLEGESLVTHAKSL